MSLYRFYHTTHPHAPLGLHLCTWHAYGCSHHLLVFVSISVALQFKEAETAKMCVAWLFAYGVTFAIIEPVQVIVLAAVPMLNDEATRCGRCVIRIRFIYNELCGLF